MRIAATPRVASEGRQLASELLCDRLARDARGRSGARGDGAYATSADSVRSDGARQRPRSSQRASSAAVELGAPARIRSASPGVGSPPAEHRRETTGTARRRAPRQAARRSRCGPPSHSSVRTPKRSSSSAIASGRSSRPSRRVRRTRPCAALAGRLAADGGDHHDARCARPAAAACPRPATGGRRRCTRAAPRWRPCWSAALARAWLVIIRP